MMKKFAILLLMIISIIFLSSCITLEIVDPSANAQPYESVTIKYDDENNPYYQFDISRTLADSECINESVVIQPGMESSGIVEYTYNGNGVLSDTEGNIYFYDKDGFIHDKEGNPNSDKVVFNPSKNTECAGIFPKTGMYAQTFNDEPSDADGGVSDTDLSNTEESFPSGTALQAFTTSNTTISCYGNVIWKDFFPTAPNYNARAEIATLPISLTFDFENNLIEGEFCSSAEKPNNGWSQGSAEFCVTIKDSDLYREIGGTWGIDGVWDVDLDMSGAQLHWVDNEQVWAYSNQQSRFDAPFHGWLEPGDGSLYTDEVLPATLQFLCDIVPPAYIFE